MDGIAIGRAVIVLDSCGKSASGLLERVASNRPHLAGKRRARPALLLIVRSSRARRGSTLTGNGGLGRNAIRVVADVIRHLEVRRVTRCRRRQNSVGELVIRTVPRATICSDRTVDRMGREAWSDLAAVYQLGDLPSGDRDVRAQHAIAKVADPESTARPVSLMRMERSVGALLCASATASRAER